MAYKAGKNLTPFYFRKKSITRGLGKKILTQTKSPNPSTEVK